MSLKRQLNLVLGTYKTLPYIPHPTAIWPVAHLQYRSNPILPRQYDSGVHDTCTQTPSFIWVPTWDQGSKQVITTPAYLIVQKVNYSPR